MEDIFSLQEMYEIKNQEKIIDENLKKMGYIQLNQKAQREVFNYLQKKFIKNFVGVPDSTLKFFIDQKYLSKCL